MKSRTSTSRALTMNYLRAASRQVFTNHFRFHLPTLISQTPWATTTFSNSWCKEWWRTHSTLTAAQCRTSGWSIWTWLDNNSWIKVKTKMEDFTPCKAASPSNQLQVGQWTLWGHTTAPRASNLRRIEVSLCILHPNSIALNNSSQCKEMETTHSTYKVNTWITKHN